MNASPLSTLAPILPGSSDVYERKDLVLDGKPAPRAEDVARQFEEVLLRQMLGESMKSVIQNARAGEAYGYFITEALAEGISKGGGVGIRSILEAQLRSSNSETADTRKPLSFGP